LKPVQLNITLHNHQPEGNFGWVFEEAYEKAYLPFIEALERRPGVRINLHTSGPLLNWLEQNRPEYLDRVAELVRAGRIEPVGGGFYEPILSILHPRDVQGQMRRMSEFIADRFGVMPRGFWTAERVWEPSIPWFLQGTGMEYTLLDDNHFLTSLESPQPLMGLYRTEFKGEKLGVFPIDHKLRYLIPFREIDELEEYFQELIAAGRTGLLVYGDDGEKFGSWPETHKWVYEDGWMERFLSFLEQRTDLVELKLLSEYVDESRVEGLVSLPASSYREMTEWTLPPAVQLRYKDFEKWLDKEEKLEESRAFVKGGFWNNFFTRYPESYRMHRMQLFASELVQAMSPGASADEAREALWAGQCNCPYWHGVFGGLYLNSLRYANYHNLTRAIGLALDSTNTRGVRRFTPGEHGLIGPALAGRKLMLTFSEDAQYVESMLYFPSGFNFFDVLGRRPEAYHHKVLNRQEESDDEHASIHDRLEFKEEGLDKALIYDRYQRLGFTDLYASSESGPADLMSGEWDDRVESRSEAAFEIKENSIASRREIVIHDSEGLNALWVEKYVNLPDAESAEVEFGWSIKAREALIEPLTVFIEFNVTLLAGDDADRYFIANGESHRLIETADFDGSSLRMEDRWQKVGLDVVASEKERFYHYPVLTVSLSEEGVEKNYQGSAIGIQVDIPGGVREMAKVLVLKIYQLSGNHQ